MTDPQSDASYELKFSSNWILNQISKPSSKMTVKSKTFLRLTAVEPLTFSGLWSSTISDMQTIQYFWQHQKKTFIQTVNREGEQYWVSMNIEKTKLMIQSRQMNLKFNGQSIHQVSRFTYLGQLLVSNGKADDEIKRRIEIA